MCGIAGAWAPDAGLTVEILETRARRMTDAIAHRGPDDDQTWVDPAAGFALGFRRLAIIDLTAEGRQPMLSRDGRYVLVLNGEIYNFEDLRAELAATGERFRGRSDTEVLLAAISRWGFTPTLKRCNGMFAIALWDRSSRTLSLARDRLGEKPLYYGWSGDAFLFASELTALRRHPAFRGEVDRAALAAYVRLGYVPGPRSIYVGISKLPPSTTLTVDGSRGVVPHPVAYWSAADVAEIGARSPSRGTPAELTAELEALLTDAVRIRMISDVPLGAFLSGGADSSTVVALMQSQSPRPIKTFTVGFEDPAYDESRHAAAVARHLGTDHTAIVLTDAEVLEVVPRMSAIYDEPFADSSQVPTYLVSRLARGSVTVTLSGDGGDELFAGYNRYSVARSLRTTAGRLPLGTRRAVAGAARMLSPGHWDAIFATTEPFLPRRFRQRNFGDKVHKLASALGARRERDMYAALMWRWLDENPVRGDGTDGDATVDGLPHFEDPIASAMYQDMTTYLPDDILVKLDRASMAVSLESRVPLLDHRVVELAWRIPLDLKIRGLERKWLLRQVLHRYVPSDLVERPKAGFAVALGVWLRGPLHSWAQELLEPSRLAREGYFEPGPITRRWKEHLSGRRNWADSLWSALMFQAWLERVA